MTAKFTKGPWSVKGDWMIVDSNERLIAQFEPLNDELSNGNTPESFANASIIACAPEMCEMLEQFKDFAVRQGWQHVLINEAEKLLAKARGEV